MRRFAAICCCLYLTSPVSAQEWQQYVNPRFGTVIATPPGYLVEMESDNADGALFVSPSRDEALLVWGSNLSGETLQQHYTEQLASDEALGWRITYQARGDGWRVYSGTMNDRILYAKLLAACQGKHVQHFKFEYAASRKQALDPVVERLSNSLKSRKGIDCN
jgi:hypothetical protein